MNIYYKKRTALYSGGVILIAANSIKEAEVIFNNTDDYITDEYKDDNFHLLNGAVATCIVPQVLLEEGYSE